MRTRRTIVVAAAGIAVASSGLTGAGAASRAYRATAPCHVHATYGVIPRWTRAGFSGVPKMNYVVGTKGKIAGLLFASPLKSPPQPGQDNKILWVARHPDSSGANLRIQAVRMVGPRQVGARVQRMVTRGPRPSIINLPEPGCWRFTLSWAGNEDTVDLRYVAQ